MPTVTDPNLTDPWTPSWLVSWTHKLARDVIPTLVLRAVVCVGVALNLYIAFSILWTANAWFDAFTFLVTLRLLVSCRETLQARRGVELARLEAYRADRRAVAETAYVRSLTMPAHPCHVVCQRSDMRLPRDVPDLTDLTLLDTVPTGMPATAVHGREARW